jgi:hypothetical protein
MAHTITIRASDGHKNYEKTLSATEGQPAKFNGPVGGPDTDNRVRLYFSGTLAGDSGRPGEVKLSYVVELSNQGRSQQGHTGRSTTLQGESVINLRPGASIKALECGPYTIELTLDGTGTAEAAWDPATSGNYLLTADFRRGKARQLYRQFVTPGAENHVVLGGISADSRGVNYTHQFILNTQAKVSRAGTGFDFEYQFLNKAAPPAKTLQFQNQLPLALGRNSAVEGPDYRLDFLLQGEPPSNGGASATSASHSDAASDDDSKAVPLLR